MDLEEEFDEVKVVILIIVTDIVVQTDEVEILQGLR